MRPVAEALLQECEELDIFVSAHAELWSARTAFFGWDGRDEILHLFHTDKLALAAVECPARFRDMVADMRARQAQGLEISEQARRDYADWDRERTLREWRSQYRAMCARFGAGDPKQRIGWFGPDMSLKSLTTARQMEVWAHGQDVWDVAGLMRPAFDRLRNICEIGVRTFGWSFVNRKLPIPAPPRVVLVAPSGAVWVWNDDGDALIRGSAVDFALVVTQRRNVADTALEAVGEAAHQWMRIAQCFAGPPLDAPAPGARILVPASPD